jgi:two-component system OmpR family sensor kinase
MSIRARLTIAIALVILVTVAVLGTVAVQTTRATLIKQVDDRVLGFVDYSEKWADQDEPPPPPSSSMGPDGYPIADSSTSSGDPEGNDFHEFARMVYDADGTLTDWQFYGYPDDPAPLPKCPPMPSEELDNVIGNVVTLPATEGDLTYRTLIQQRADGGYLAVAAPLTPVDAAVSDLMRVVVIATGAALLAAVGICWWVIRRGLKPVDQMVATAATIAGGDLGARVADVDPHTELGRLGGALNDMMGKIQKADDARAAGERRLRRFVADAAHELRTPLTSLRGYAELYRQGALKDDAAVTNAMGRIESEGARMARLVDDLLLLARLDQDRGVERTPVDLGDEASDAMEAFRVVAPERSATLTVESGTIVAGDRMRLRQIVDNLLSNVRTHTPATAEVRVTVAQRGSRAILTVADTGPGIAPEDQERIFERFWRADPARTRSRGGSGLGLAIVASLVEAHDGTIRLESVPGEGAAFIVSLPLAAPDRPGRTLPADAPLRPLARALRGGNRPGTPT